MIDLPSSCQLFIIHFCCRMFFYKSKIRCPSRCVMEEYGATFAFVSNSPPELQVILGQLECFFLTSCDLKSLKMQWLHVCKNCCVETYRNTSILRCVGNPSQKLNRRSFDDFLKWSPAQPSALQPTRSHFVSSCSVQARWRAKPWKLFWGITMHLPNSPFCILLWISVRICRNCTSLVIPYLLYVYLIGELSETMDPSKCDWTLQLERRERGWTQQWSCDYSGRTI